MVPGGSDRAKFSYRHMSDSILSLAEHCTALFHSFQFTDWAKGLIKSDFANWPRDYLIN